MLALVLNDEWAVARSICGGLYVVVPELLADDAEGRTPALIYEPQLIKGGNRSVCHISSDKECKEKRASYKS